jgi:glycosyltransferase involved in cell wall biosynthesis
MNKAKVFIIKRAFFRLMYRTAMALKKVLLPFIPIQARQTIKRGLLKKAFPIDQGRSKSDVTRIVDGTQGVNLIGYARAEMGIGESCRIAARSLTAADIPFGIINFKGMNMARMSDESWKHKEFNEPIYDVNIFHVNAEQMMEVYAQYGNRIFENKYNIGYWHWELPEFPDAWQEGFQFVDEVWVPSSFVANSVAMNSPVPVVRIPHGIEVRFGINRDRSYYNIPEHTFLFLTMYDIKSYQERKNPYAAIAAFKLAFDSNDRTVGLVIKVNSAKSGENELILLRQLVEGYENIYLITDILSREDTNALINVVDCYISLHRSEGFGLGLAEAMYLGKPAIGTNWSSNTDFMNNQNSCLVNYELIQIDKDYGPYKAGQLWADPDVEHASSFMKRLVSDEQYYRLISTRGKHSIRRDFSPAAAGGLARKRLQYIKLNLGG